MKGSTAPGGYLFRCRKKGVDDISPTVSTFDAESQIPERQVRISFCQPNNLFHLCLLMSWGHSD